MPNSLRDMLTDMWTYSLLFAAIIAIAGTPVVALGEDQVSDTGMSFNRALEIGKSIYFQRVDATVTPNRVRKDGTPVHGPDIIKSDLVECLHKNGSTAGMNGCYGEAYKKYDEVLHIIYQHLLSSNASPDGGDIQKQKELSDSIQNAQEKWLAFNTAENNAHSNYITASNKGTVISIVISIEDISSIRERIAELMMYYGVGEG